MEATIPFLKRYHCGNFRYCSENEVCLEDQKRFSRCTTDISISLLPIFQYQELHVLQIILEFNTVNLFTLPGVLTVVMKTNETNQRATASASN